MLKEIDEDECTNGASEKNLVIHDRSHDNDDRKCKEAQNVHRQNSVT